MDRSSGSAEPPKSLSLEERLGKFQFDRDVLEETITGKIVPSDLGSPEVQACVIRAIRHHNGYGKELRGYAAFDRALNARAIMSNRIPEIHEKEQEPYCIWYPEIATEDTYRKLVTKYPQMKYQVGRACAVAGYVNLYRELDLLPEVSIAEEARDNAKNGISGQIYDEIVAAPEMLSVMDDYTRTINMNTPRRSAVLNADTAVRSSLDRRRLTSRRGNPISQAATEYVGLSPAKLLKEYRPFKDADSYWNITEDWKYDNEDAVYHDDEGMSWKRTPPYPDLRVPLLYSPLPTHLPNINKDVLIFHAAYNGNVDRYARLRRPLEVDPFEEECIIRGILHSTTFAKWWSLQTELLAGQSEPNHPHAAKLRAINARFIMNNNMTRITKDTPEDQLPYQIYWPNLAYEFIYERLFKVQPCMKLQIARACIIANYESLYQNLDVEGHEDLMLEATQSRNPFYVDDQRAKGMTNRPQCAQIWRQDFRMKNIKDLMASNIISVDASWHKLEEGSQLPEYWTDQQPAFEEEDYEVSVELLEEELGRTRLPLYEQEKRIP